MSAKTNFLSKIWHLKKNAFDFFQSNAKKMKSFAKSWSKFEKHLIKFDRFDFDVQLKINWTSFFARGQRAFKLVLKSIEEEEGGGREERRRKEKEEERKKNVKRKT